MTHLWVLFAEATALETLTTEQTVRQSQCRRCRATMVVTTSSSGKSTARFIPLGGREALTEEPECLGSDG